MKRTILVLTLLLCTATLATGSPDDGDIRIPSPARSLSSGDVGDQINLAGNLTSNSSGVTPYINDPPSVSMWVSLLALLY